MNITQTAKRNDGTVLKRGDIVVSMQTARNLTFAYVTDNGEIATQEPGRLPIITPASRLLDVTVVKETPMNPIAFNPDTMTISRVKHCVETLRTAFDLIERGCEAEDIRSYLVQAADNMLKQWGEPK